MVNRWRSTCLVALVAWGCAGRATVTAPVVTRGGVTVDGVTLTPLAGGVWVHTTWGTIPSGELFPSNGLLVCEGGDGLLVDTAWTDAQTERLLTLAEARGCPVRALVVTHFHNDRMGGIGAVLRRRIATHALPETVARAHLTEWPVNPVSSPGEVRAGRVVAEVFFPGEAHTADNVVVWLRGARVLFGGCMVRAADGRSLGNIADANVAAYPVSARRLVERYSDALHVVPGHGAPGDAGLLTHTVALAEAAQRR